MLVCATAALLMQIWQLVALHHYVPAGISEKNIQTKVSYQLFLEGMKELYRLWSVGDIDGLWAQDKMECQDILGSAKNVHASYLACNPSLLECYGRKSSLLRFRHQGQTYHLRLRRSFQTIDGEKRFYRIISRALQDGARVPSYGVQVDLEIKERSGHHLSVVLEDICGQAFLPNDVYAYGPYVPARLRKGASEWRWDNMDRYLYLDKFLVNNRDIVDWVDYGGGPSHLKNGASNKMLAAPATNLTAKEMEQYCAFRGKNVMQAHVYDAATFKPNADNRNKDGEIFRAPYPWSNKENEGFLALANRDPDYQIALEDCAKAYVLECTELVPYLHHAKESSSWIGMYQIMGGYLEYMQNTLEPDKNVKASSFYFASRAPWHQLAKRFHWDGQGHGHNNFQTGTLPEINGDYEVAFRCFREVDRAL